MTSSLLQLQPSKCSAIGSSCLAMSLRRADRMVTQIYDATFRGLGLKATQFGLLVTIQGLQPVTITAVAETISVDRTTLTRNLAILEKSGLVRTEPGEDLRERKLQLTAKGRRLLADAYPAWRKTQKRINDLVGVGHVEALLKSLSRLAEAMI